MKFDMENIKIDHWIIEMLAVVGILSTLGLGIVLAFKAFWPLGVYFFLSAVAVAYYAKRDQDITDSVMAEAKEILEAQKEARNVRSK